MDRRINYEVKRGILICVCVAVWCILRAVSVM